MNLILCAQLPIMVTRMSTADVEGSQVVISPVSLYMEGRKIPYPRKGQISVDSVDDF